MPDQMPQRTSFFDVILGTLIHRYIIRQLPPDPEFLERLTSLTWFLYQGCPRD